MLTETDGVCCEERKKESSNP